MLAEILQRGDIIEPLLGNGGWRFRDKLINDYFMSKVLRRELAGSSPARITEIISRNNFHFNTDALPFLVGDFRDARMIMGKILSVLKEKKSGEAYAARLREEFPAYLSHIQPSEDNIRLLEGLHQGEMGMPSEVRRMAGDYVASVRSEAGVEEGSDSVLRLERKPAAGSHGPPGAIFPDPR